jgi:copper(I)-binding protein
MRFHALLALLLAALSLSACVSTAPKIAVADPWVRAATVSGAAEPMATPAGAATAAPMQMGEMPAGVNSAAFMTLSNPGAQPDRLLSAAGDLSASVEIHETTMENDVMRMRPVEGGIEIPAGGQVELKPGGYHIMLMGLTRDLKPGETVQLTLTFERAGEVEVTAQVRQP